MIRSLALVLVAAATILWGCDNSGESNLPAEPPLFLLDDETEIDDGSGGGGSGGTTTSSWDGFLNFQMEGRTYYSGRRQLVSCDTLTLVEVVWDSFPPHRIETKRRHCEEQPSHWGGAVIATVTWNGSSERIAAFEADYEKMASEAYELESGESLTLKLDADPYTWDGCQFRYFYAWKAGVHNYSDPAYFTLDPGDDDELFTARFDCD